MPPDPPTDKPLGVPTDSPARRDLFRESPAILSPERAAPGDRPVFTLPKDFVPPTEPTTESGSVSFEVAERARLAAWERQLEEQARNLALAERMFQGGPRGTAAPPPGQQGRTLPAVQQAVGAAAAAAEGGSLRLDVPQRRPQEAPVFDVAKPVEYTGRFVTKHCVIISGYDFQANAVGRVEVAPKKVLISSQLPRPELERALGLGGGHKEGADQICSLAELKTLLQNGAIFAEQREMVQGPIDSPFGPADDDDEPPAGLGAHGAHFASPQ